MLIQKKFKEIPRFKIGNAKLLFVNVVLLSMLILPLVMTGSTYAQSAKCPDGSNAPSGNADNCPVETWTIKCFEPVTHTENTIGDPKRVDCPEALKNRKSEDSCFKVKVIDSTSNTRTSTVQTPCINKKNTWTIKCYDSSNNQKTCTNKLWEFAATDKCFQVLFENSGITEMNCSAFIDEDTSIDTPVAQEIPEPVDISLELDVPSTGGDTIAEQVRNFYRLLIAGVGLVSLIMLVTAGLQYMTARENPQAVQAAKSKIYNVFIAIFSFVFLTAFLEWLIGGIVT